ncbi:MAG: DUF2993 domain-containing protein [Chloroflexi bacterium]|nr:DUF2993 domain-containing protein [Chloroflexota bacterium]
MRVLILVVVIAALGYGAVQVLSQTQQRAAPAAEPLPSIAVTPAAARSFDEKLSAMEKAVEDARRSGRATPVEVTFTEQELTSKLADVTLSGTAGLVATDIQVHLSGGNVVTTSKVSVQGLHLNVGIVATPVVEGGQAKLVIKDIQTGGVPFPDALKQQIQAQLGQAIDPSALGLPFEVTKVQVLDGKVVISGNAKP